MFIAIIILVIFSFFIFTFFPVVGRGIWFFWIANSRAKKKDFQGALIYYNKALSCAPFALCYWRRANVKCAIGDDISAIEDYGLALNIEGNFFHAYRDRAIARWRQGDLAGALADFDSALNIRNSDVAVLYKRERVKFLLSDIHGASN